MQCSEQASRQWPELWNALVGARRRGRLGHAFLISSDRGDVRENFALALAALAACSGGAANAPCGHCTTCRQLDRGSYAELHHLSPVGRGYVIQVGDRRNPEPNTVRYFEEQFHLTNLSGAASKVGIIHDADRMNDEAQNALLKTLEEPPPETLIVLTTGNPAALLPTTRSRCQQLQLRVNSLEFTFAGHEELFAALAALERIAPDDLNGAERAAARIIAVSERLRGSEEERVAGDWSERIAMANELDPALAKRLGKQQEDIAAGAYRKTRVEFLSAIHTFCAQRWLLASGAAPEHLPNPEILPPSPDGVDPDRAAWMLKLADELLYQLRFNVNESLALRNFAIQCAMPPVRQRVVTR